MFHLTTRQDIIPFARLEIAFAGGKFQNISPHCNGFWFPHNDEWRCLLYLLDPRHAHLTLPDEEENVSVSRCNFIQWFWNRSLSNNSILSSERVATYLPELSPNLVSALSCLNMNDFPHDWIKMMVSMEQIAASVSLWRWLIRARMLCGWLWPEQRIDKRTNPMLVAGLKIENGVAATSGGRKPASA